MSDGHLPRVPTGQAPGGGYIRIGSVETGELLRAYPVTIPEDVRTHQREDEALIEDWFLTHPTDEVHLYLYDGDSGECRRSIIVRGPEAARR